MTDLVPPTEIEAIVGAKRHPTRHQGRLDRLSQTAYILHSQECLDSGIDLRLCGFSHALDVFGVDEQQWPEGPVFVTTRRGSLEPCELRRQP